MRKYGKLVLSFLLVAIMVLQVASVGYAAGADTKAVGAITYTIDEDGTYTAYVSARGLEKNARLIIAEYEGGKVVNSNVSTLSADPFIKVILKPTNTSNPVKAFLWYDSDKEPLTKGATLGNDITADDVEIYIDGVPFAEAVGEELALDAEFSYTLEGEGNPKITWSAKNSNIDADVAFDAANDKAVVTFKAGKRIVTETSLKTNIVREDYEKEFVHTVTINFVGDIVEESLISALTYHLTGSYSQACKKMTFDGNTNRTIYSDRNGYGQATTNAGALLSYPEAFDLKDAVFISTFADRHASYGNATPLKFYSFTANKDCEVLVFSEEKHTYLEDAANGWSKKNDLLVTDSIHFINNLNSSDDRALTHLYRKVFKAGSTVELYTPGNVGKFVTFVKELNIKHSADAASITVGGEALAGFNANTTEYTYTLSDISNTSLPYVEATAADDTTEVEVTYNTSYYGTPSATVTLTTIDGKVKTYTINFAYGEALISNLVTTSQAGNNPATIQSNMKIGDTFIGDRSWKITALYSEYEGKDWIRGRVNWRDGYNSVWSGTTVISDWLTFNVNRAATVHILTQSYNGNQVTALTSNDWTKVRGSEIGTTNLIDTDNANGDCTYAYKKKFDADSTVSIPNMGAYAFAVVVIADDWVEGRNSAADLATLTVDGAPLAGFDTAITEYTYNMSDISGASLPVVAATAVNDNADVAVTYNKSYYGTPSATVTVTSGSTVATYTINFTYGEALISNLVTTSQAGNNPATIQSNMKIGDTFIGDRTWKISALYSEYVGKDWIRGRVNWRSSYNSVWSGTTVIPDWLTFEINHNATVHILTTSYNGNQVTSLTNNGWTKVRGSVDLNVTNIIDCDNSNGDCTYTYKKPITVDPETGKATVQIPNMGGYAFAVVVVADDWK